MSINKNEGFPLTGRETDIMAILWNLDKPMLASEIAASGDQLSINTVQAAMKSLLRKGMIEVADIVYSGTVLSRTYRPTLSRQQYMVSHLRQYFQSLGNDYSTVSLVSALLDNDKDERIIDELEEMLRQRKEEFKESE